MADSSTDDHGFAVPRNGAPQRGAGIMSERADGIPERPEPGPLLVGLGLAVLVGERLSPRAPSSRSLAVLVGLARRAAERGRQAVALAGDSPTLVLADAVAWGADFPAKDVASAPLAHGRRALSAAATDAEVSGTIAIIEGRAKAVAVLRQAVDDTVAWAQHEVVPRVVDGMVPHLVSTVVPQLIDGALPEIRAKIVPIVVEDLTGDPRFQEMLREHAREVASETADRMRATAADG